MASAKSLIIFVKPGSDMMHDARRSEGACPRIRTRGSATKIVTAWVAGHRSSRTEVVVVVYRWPGLEFPATRSGRRQGRGERENRVEIDLMTRRAYKANYNLGEKEINPNRIRK
jgi:hypothetical protein